MALRSVKAVQRQESDNAWDSLAEALLSRGDKQKAIEYYQKSLVLNPKNKNAAAMLAKLRSQT